MDILHPPLKKNSCTGRKTKLIARLLSLNFITFVWKEKKSCRVLIGSPKKAMLNLTFISKVKWQSLTA